MRRVPKSPLCASSMAAIWLTVTVAASVHAQPVADPVAEQNPSGDPSNGPDGGSFGPGVYVEDITNTIRLADFRHIAISKQNPNVAYVGSFHGYVFKTTDGGRTWDESRLVIDRNRYYGDRAQEAYFGAQRTDGTIYPLHRTGEVLDAGYRGEGNKEVRMASDVIGMHAMDLSHADRVSESANRQWGVGLPGRAPRLQNVVRRFGKPTSGLNLKQTLLLRGTVPTTVRAVVIHPHNPKIVFACTKFGLYMTEDAGLNWVRIFLGESPSSRTTNHVAVDPLDGKRVLLATENGMFISRDGGHAFQKASQQGVGEGKINWIRFDPYDPHVVFAAIDYGLLRSLDRGKTWDWIYFTTFPTARIVRYIEVDPFDQKTGYIATNDGLFWTENILTASLEDWKRLGGLRFTGHETVKVSANPRRRGHLWAQTVMRVKGVESPTLVPAGGSFLWESLDHGKTWRVVYSGNTYGYLAWYEEDPRDPELLWLVWTGSLGRLRRKKPGGPEPATGQDIRREPMNLPEHLSIDKTPSMPEVIQAVWRYSGVSPGQQLAYRALSRWKALAPRVDFSVTGYRATDYGLMDDGIYLPTLPFRRRQPRTLDYVDYRVMFQWDLMPLVFNLESVLFGRVERISSSLRALMVRPAFRLYGEFRRLQGILTTQPPRDLRTRLFYRLRLDEIYSYIDIITGHYLSRYAKGDRPNAGKTRWMHEWD